MLLTITTTYSPATDLGYLLHKNPARLQSVEVAGGVAHVFYPEATAERCTAALLLDLDPVGLVRGRGAALRCGFRGRICSGAVRERPAICGLVLPERGAEQSLRHGHERHLQGPAEPTCPSPVAGSKSGRRICARP